MIRLAKVELLEHFQLRNDSNPRKLLLVADRDVRLEYDETAGLLWVRVEGEHDRFIPREHLKWAQIPATPPPVAVVKGGKR